MAGRPVNGLTVLQEQAIVALLNQPSISKAAKTVGVGERTLYRWLDEPAFSRVYRKARREAYAQAIALTQRYAPMAVNCLARLINDPGVPHSVKATASGMLLKFGRESIELDDLAERVEALEAAGDGAGAPEFRPSWSDDGEAELPQDGGEEEGA